MTDLLQRIDRSIQHRDLLPDGENLLVGVSGGLDSMVLLCALKTLSSRHRWRLAIAHFNHQLRGRASDADEAFVRKTAAALKLPLVVGRHDVKAFARRSRLSVEMAARKLRHEFFARTARDRRTKTIALAHHADDQVELFFIRLLRGAGVDGLAGMKWRSPSAVDPAISLIRPLLDVRKAELAAFAQGQEIRFREDATNRANDFLRNRIRNELLPLLEKKYQPAMTAVVLRLMEILGAESDFVRDVTHLCSRPDDAAQIEGKKRRQPESPDGFDRWPVAIQRRVLQTHLSRAGVASDFDLIETLRLAPDVPVDIGANLSVTRGREGRVQLRERATVSFDPTAMRVSLDRSGKILFDGTLIQWRMSPRTLPFKEGREMFDADRVGAGIVLRHWRAGDRFQPIGLASAKKLQDLFMDAKVPREERHQRIIATTAAGEIFWVEGLRMAERFKVGPKTTRRLIWAWRRNSRRFADV